MSLAIASNNEQQVVVTAVPVTSSGRPAPVDGPLTVTVQSGSGTVFQDPATPLSFKAVSGDDAGETVYLVEADADLGAGRVTISDTVVYTVTSATAQAVGLVAGAVEPKVAAAARRGRG